MQFLLLATNDVNAGPNRRAELRPAHAANARELHEKGQLLAGGRVLDDAGSIIGSMMIVEFPTRAEVDAWLAKEPYAVGKLWKDVNVRIVQVTVTKDGPPPSS